MRRSGCQRRPISDAPLEIRASVDRMLPLKGLSLLLLVDLILFFPTTIATQSDQQEFD